MNKPKPLKFEHKLVSLLLVAALLPSFLLLVSMTGAQISVYLILFTFFCLTLIIGYCAYALHTKTTYQLRSLTNLLIGLGEGDYSVRGISHRGHDTLGELVQQINSLADTLSEHRFIAHDSQLLVSKIIQHIDVAIIAIDEKETIALLNPAAETLLSTTQETALGKLLSEYKAQEILSIDDNLVVNLSFAPAQMNYQVIRDNYREQGQHHQLFFITNVHGLLRQHEREAWQNLIRVLSHEINNSLSPIASIASTLKDQATKQELPSFYAENLFIMGERAKSLKGFIDSYRKLSFLPSPQKERIDIANILSKVEPLFTPRKFTICNTLEQDILVDPVQLEQVLINLIKNAEEAMQEVENKENMASDERAIDMTIQEEKNRVHIAIKDLGYGIQNSDNLFTPFYSTKQKGSGIGLLLSRQIVEAHEGYLLINNRTDIKGCIVHIYLPL